MVNWNSVRTSFDLLALVALLAACSSSTVETTPTGIFNTERRTDPLGH